VLEFKTHSVKSFTELTAKGVVLAKPQHAAQMQIYMHLTGITRALYVAVCKDTDALHIERIEADSAMAERLLDKAGRIIFAQHPPARISEDPAWFECRFCDHHAVCHEGGGAAVTCRSCLHATPVDGGWHCARHDRMLAPADQRRPAPAISSSPISSRARSSMRATMSSPTAWPMARPGQTTPARRRPRHADPAPLSTGRDHLDLRLFPIPQPAIRWWSSRPRAASRSSWPPSSRAC
jgi:hypothetical protein